MDEAKYNVQRDLHEKLDEIAELLKEQAQRAASSAAAPAWRR